mmetsp:Transcript_43132/g.88272  ORF Transcript_43132/g.88272 Transcript_43132/m.88272 type:complete len:311 (-) Transcript_43132:709-1641(-)
MVKNPMHDTARVSGSTLHPPASPDLRFSTILAPDTASCFWYPSSSSLMLAASLSAIALSSDAWSNGHDPAPASTACLPLTSNTLPCFTSIRTKDGMPRTSNNCPSSPLRARSENASASHGIDPKYSSNAAWSLSLDTNTTSNFLSIALSFSYIVMSMGVNLRHGGHQCALKYIPTISLLAATSSTFSSVFAPPTPRCRTLFPSLFNSFKPPSDPLISSSFALSSASHSFALASFQGYPRAPNFRTRVNASMLPTSHFPSFFASTSSCGGSTGSLTTFAITCSSCSETASFSNPHAAFVCPSSSSLSVHGM